MHSDSSDRRTRFYNRVAKASLIGSVVGFGSLLAIVYLRLDRNVAIVLVAVASAAMVMSAFTMVGAIAARDIPTWRKNRWRFSTTTLLNLMMCVAMVLGTLSAAVRGVSVGGILMAGVGFVIASFIVNTIYINWSRFRHFNALNADGRYLDWNTVADRLTSGEGTLLVGKCYQIPTVWWSERKISTLDEARDSIESDALITICPQRKRIAQWLKSTFPTVPVVELDAGKIHLAAGT
jgi:hypothetical protein